MRAIGHPDGIRAGSYSSRVAARQLSLSSSIASLHGDERTVGSPLNKTELLATKAAMARECPASKGPGTAH